jgi:hypothetical protein
MFDNFMFSVSTFKDIFLCCAVLILCYVLLMMKRFQEEEKVTRIWQWDELHHADRTLTRANAATNTRVDKVYEHLSKSRFQRVEESSRTHSPSGRPRKLKPTSPPRFIID